MIRDGTRVLIVEDEPLVTMMLEDMLSELGCIVAGKAATFEQAMTLVQTAAFDVAILDVNVGGKLTYPAADALAGRSIPFILSTGYSAENMPERFRAMPCLGKPFVSGDLEKAVATALSGARVG